MDLAQSLNIAMVKATIESVPRTIIPVSTRNDTPITTKPVIKGDSPQIKETKVKKEVKPKLEEKEIKEKKLVEQKVEVNPTISDKAYEFDGVHLNIYDYFDLSPSTANKQEVDKLRKINEWAFRSKGNIGEALSKIEKATLRMGKSKIGYESLVRLYNYIRVRELR